MLRYCMCMCMYTFLDESLLIKVSESFETVTNGVAATGCNNHVHKDVYKLLASQLERGNGDWRIRTKTQHLNLWLTL